jgi:hypothetical protein
MATAHRLGLLLVVSSLTLAAQGGYIITTLAGGAPPPSPVPAVSASVGGVQAVATDGAGNLYLSTRLNCVFKVDATGVMTLVAGNGRRGFSGDGGPATSAELNWPSAIAVDAAGNLFIADTGNNIVRKVTPAGIIASVYIIASVVSRN